MFLDEKKNELTQIEWVHLRQEAFEPVGSYPAAN
jgi:hypothetical protein